MTVFDAICSLLNRPQIGHACKLLYRTLQRNSRGSPPRRPLFSSDGAVYGDTAPFLLGGQAGLTFSTSYRALETVKRNANESTDDYRAENLGEPLERTVAAHSVSQIAHTPILTTGKISVSRVE
jgi:hypothetical protein